MKLKNHLTFGAWAFYIGEGDEQIRVPAEGFLRTKRALINAVRDTMMSLASQGKDEYMKRAEEEAAAMNLPIADYFDAIVQHQICTRMSSSKGVCLPSGIGDKIHSFVANVDAAAARMPAPVRKTYEQVAAAVTKKILGTAHTKLSGCSSCGGTKSFRKSTWNMGRAGRLK
jgi:hypothetical protein